MKRQVRSYLLALRATTRFARALKLRAAGKKSEALRIAHEALAILSHPHVVRSNPAEAAAIASSTVLVEELAVELSAPGARKRDLADALWAIRMTGPTGELASWIPHLERSVETAAN